MTHRTNWSVLSHTDPIPDNVPDLRDAAAEYKKISQAIADARDELEKITTKAFQTEMISEAVDKIRADAASVHTGLDQVQGRYSVIANALMTYAEAVDPAQNSAGEAEGDAQNAKAAMDAASAAYSSASNQVGILGLKQIGLDAAVGASDVLTAGTGDLFNAREAAQSNETALKAAQAKQSDAHSDLAAATAKMKAAEEKYKSAISAYNSAGQAAASAIQKAINDGLNDNWFKDLLKVVADFVINIAETMTQAMAEIAKGLEEVAKALADLMVDGANLLDGLVTGDWGKCAQALSNMGSHSLDLLNGVSDLSDGLSKITSAVGAVVSLVGIVVPALEPIGAALGLASLAFAGAHMIADTGLAAFNSHGKTAEDVLADGVGVAEDAVDTMIGDALPDGAASDIFTAVGFGQEVANDGSGVDIGIIPGALAIGGVDTSFLNNPPYVYSSTNNMPSLQNTPTTFTLHTVDAIATSAENGFNYATNSLEGAKNWIDAL